MLTKEKLSLVSAEFLGTAMLAIAVLMVSHLFSSGTAAWYVSLTAGATLALIVGTIGHVSGAHVNPAVTIGMWTLKKIETTNAIVYIAAQLLGGAIALIVYNYLTNEAVASVGASTFDWRVFSAEALGSAIFGMGIIAAVSQKTEGFWKAYVIGGSLAGGALVASVASAGFLNPAVVLGNNGWDRTFVIAPIVGVVVGMNVYSWLFVPAVKKSKR